MKLVTVTFLLGLLSVSSFLYGPKAAAPPNSPFDSYGILRWEDETARLDNFAIQLQNYEKALGFILVYDETGGCPGEAQARAIRAKRYIVEHRGVRWNQVIWRREGYRMDAGTTLIIAPPGAYVAYPWGGPSTDPAVDGPLTAACKATLRKIRKSRW